MREKYELYIHGQVGRGWGGQAYMLAIFSRGVSILASFFLCSPRWFLFLAYDGSIFSRLYLF